MRSILVHAHDDGEFDARLQAALDLTRAFGGHLTLLQAIAFDFAVPGDFYGAMASQLAPVIREQAEAFRAEVEARLRGEDVSWDWVDRMGMGDTALLHRAALSDLVVVGAHTPESGKGPSWLAGALAIHARVPVLAVPQGCSGVKLDGPAFVAWNGSSESSRALRAAVPLLARASAVTLATIGQGETEGERVDLPPVQGAEYLARHGIECELVEFPASAGRNVGEIVAKAATAREAGYIVMGAYGHSRLLETVLGGTTRSLLSDAPMPLFLAH